jgi:hypothetical protein
MDDISSRWENILRQQKQRNLEFLREWEEFSFKVLILPIRVLGEWFEVYSDNKTAATFFLTDCQGCGNRH